MRVLIVDDNEEMRESLKTLLEEWGYEVDVAADGQQALALQDRHPADTLLTDLFMPEQDGLETIQSFRARFPQMRIIAMSGDAHIRFKTDFLAVAREAGADVALRKPFAAAALRESLIPA